MRRAFTALLAGAAMGLALGCGSASHEHTLVLVMASGEPAGLDHVPAVKRFVDLVGKLSGGRMRIAVRLVRENPGNGGAPFPVDDQSLLRGVTRGRFALTWVDTRVFAALGDRDFEALGVPLLIDDYATQAAVVESRAATLILARARRLGVEGLALLAGPMRKPVGLRRPLLSPRDYRGTVLRTLDSRLGSRAARALGALPIHDQYPYPVLYTDILNRHVGGLEDDLDSLFFEVPPAAPVYVTANVNLWPRTRAIVMNPRRLAALTPRQRGWIRQAAAAATRYSTTVADRDGELARELCRNGGRLANASAGQRAALRSAFAPLYGQLRRTPAVAPMLKQIETIKRRSSHPAQLAVPAGCGARFKARPAAVRTAGTTVPNGVYRVRITRADLRAGGAGAVEVDRSAGTFTLTLYDGRWTLEERGPGSYIERGIYSGPPQRVTWMSTIARQLQYLPQPRKFSMSFRPGRLDITVVNDPDITDSTWYGAHPWTKVE